MSDQTPGETPEQTKARERVRMVRWMRGIVAEKDPAAQRAFMAKVRASASYHGITLQELLDGLDKNDA